MSWPSVTGPIVGAPRVAQRTAPTAASLRQGQAPATSHPIKTGRAESAGQRSADETGHVPNGQSSCPSGTRRLKPPGAGPSG